MRIAGLLLAAVAVLSLTGCCVALAPVTCPFITTDVKGPVAVGDAKNFSRTGTAEAQGIILVAWGDASISAAMKNANPPITRIHHVDSSSLTVLGIYAKSTTTVYGE